MTAQPGLSALSLACDWLAPLAGLRVLDIGCGRGALARALTAWGAQVTGLEPDPAACAEARTSLPEGTFVEGVAQALPFADGAFDAAIFSNSLHHVPPPFMRAALEEAMRVATRVLVIEPLADGPFFEVMRPIEDETTLRHAAQAALDGVVQSGTARILRSLDFSEPRVFPDVDAFLAKVVAADPARAETAHRLRCRVAALMDLWGTPVEGDLALPQPHRAVQLQAMP